MRTALRRLAAALRFGGGSSWGAEGARQRHCVRVGAGFEPAVIVVPARTPVEIVFVHDTERLDRDRVAFPELGRLVTLREGAEIVAHLGRLKPGRYTFLCRPGAPAGTLLVHGIRRAVPSSGPPDGVERRTTPPTVAPAGAPGGGA